MVVKPNDCGKCPCTYPDCISLKDFKLKYKDHDREQHCGKKCLSRCVCTRSLLHKGDHEARVYDRCCARWPNVKEKVSDK